MRAIQLHPTLALLRTTVALVLSVAALPAAAQNQLWIQQFGTGTDDFTDAAVADGLGGVYLSGGTEGNLGGPNAGGLDIWLARYDGAYTNQLWIRQFGTSSDDAARAAAPDGSGGVYVSGGTEGSLGGPNAGGNDAWLARYDGAGNQLWIRQLGTSRDDVAYAAAADGSGGVYVGGTTEGSLGGPNAGGTDAWLTRYDSAGNQLWIRQLGTSRDDVAYAAAADGSGGVYVGGTADGSLGGPNAGGTDAWLTRYDSAGNLLWVRQLGTSSNDVAYAAAPDGSGGVYVSGETCGSLGGPNAGSTDAWLARYGFAGNLLWVRQLGTGGNDVAYAAAEDGSGGVYVSGGTEGSLGGPNVGGLDIWLARYDSAGNLLWVQQLGTSGDEWSRAAAEDGSGGVYVSGLIGETAGGIDAWLARYDMAGSLLWALELGTSSDDAGHAAAPDGSGGVYVSGDTYGSLGGPNAGSADAWLARYDSAGNQLWVRQLGTSSADAARAAAPDGSGGVYVSGETRGSLGGPNAGSGDAWLARYDSAGDQLWIRQLGTSSGDVAYAAAADGSGGVYVSGDTYGSLGAPYAGEQDAWLARYDSAGNLLWVRQLGTSGDEWSWAAAEDGSGGVYWSGHTTGNLGGPPAGVIDAWLARYDSAGNQLWILQLGTSGVDLAHAAVADGSGGVYVGGTTEGSLGGPNAGARDAWLARYDSAGTQRWIIQLGTSGGDSTGATAPDGSGGVYVSGATGGSLGGPSAGGDDAWLARYDSVGTQLWILQLGTSGGDWTGAAAPDGSGGVYVGGTTAGSLGGPPAGGRDIWLARYEGSAVIAYCFGDGSGGICPCGNNGAPGQGCANSSGAGAVVVASGSISVSADDLTILASNLLPAQPALLFAGVNVINGGNGYPFGDGLRCASGSIVRLGIRVPDAHGDAAFGPGLAALGGFGPGDLRRFQVWYRDPIGGPCSSGFNLSHGMEVVFIP